MTNLRPTGDLVAVAWLRSLTFTTAPGIGTFLPASTDWANGLFIAAMVVAGAPDPYVPLHSPAVQVDCWATDPDPLVKWRAAAQMAERIAAATYTAGTATVALPSGYDQARLTSVSALGDPRRIEGDPSDAARVTQDLRLTWITAATGAFT